MERGKWVMQPVADFDLNMEPVGSEEECKKANKARIFELEAELDHMIVPSKKEATKRNKELKKMLIEYIEENEMPIKIEEQEKYQNLLWESIIVLKELINMDPEVSSSQYVISDNKKN